MNNDDDEIEIRYETEDKIIDYKRTKSPNKTFTLDRISNEIKEDPPKYNESILQRYKTTSSNQDIFDKINNLNDSNNKKENLIDDIRNEANRRGLGVRTLGASVPHDEEKEEESNKE